MPSPLGPHTCASPLPAATPLCQLICPRLPRFTKELKDESAGLLAAAFIGIVPGYISRSVAGSYDNEAIAIFLLMFTFFAWIKALKQGSAFWGTIAAVFYFYMVAAWGMPSPTSFQVQALTKFPRWICIHYKHDSSPCARLDAHGSFHRSPLCRVFILVRDRYIV